MSLLSSGFRIKLAARALRAGNVVACPTEAVWGLSVDLYNQAAVTKLLALKQRSWQKGLIVVAADWQMLAPLVRLPSNSALKRALATWPGPHTWVFPASDLAPLWVTGLHPSIAVRVTKHPQLAALCKAFGGPMVSTSANRAGQPPARTRLAVQRRLGRDLVLVPGATGGLDKPTIIREAASGHILRS